MKRAAFTLIELLVVISIIGLLSTVAVVATNSSRVKARDAKRVADIVQLQKALELYYAVNGQYPLASGSTSPNVQWSTSDDAGWTALQTRMGPYMATLPKDPTQSASGWAVDANTFTYSYYSAGFGCPQQWYMIVYRLEVADGKPDPGVTACDGTFFQYGGSGSSTQVKTVGTRAQ